ncbi:DUF5133 domain-containing protein [Streptomyces sp. FIT100]|uniref:DUF5133 domain-containing protein n=1 Tax=Streptomyces sp. FIT100 TaxID=2837956 RepID=UPI0021CA2F03|nr:DUF5133 domain-containing protein [Streptomyces sp. FIT100]
MPDLKALRSLLARYADLRIAAPKNEESRIALHDVTCTLCGMTATGTIEEALEKADELLHSAATATSVPPPSTDSTAPVPRPDDDEVTLVA